MDLMSTYYCLPGSILGTSESLARGRRQVSPELFSRAKRPRENQFCPEHQGRLLGVGGSLGRGDWTIGI